jgi:hypothetical protein
MNELPAHIKELLNDKGYFTMFYQMTIEFNTHEETFDALESLFYNFYGKNKYTSYESFRVAKCRYLKNK